MLNSLKICRKMNQILVGETITLKRSAPIKTILIKGGRKPVVKLEPNLTKTPEQEIREVYRYFCESTTNLRTPP